MGRDDRPIPGALAMREGDKIRGIIERAVESAFINFPDAGNGITWPPHYKLRSECVTLATAILAALEKPGYKIVPNSN